MHLEHAWATLRGYPPFVEPMKPGGYAAVDRHVLRSAAMEAVTRETRARSALANYTLLM
jgi:hypothetical protein